MKTELMLTTYIKYSKKLEDELNRLYGDRPSIHVHLHDLWLNSVEESLNELSQQEDDSNGM